MKRVIAFILLCIVVLFILTGCTSTKQEEGNFKIVTSFYPMYILALNLTDGIADVTLENMTDSNVRLLT